MQLSKIKLSGFKSFVDPTTIPLPSNLVAIVGPNGCGKSNIIDAVTWVMGESSPKYLRGEALTDVIFNGSSARKPVGQASVELIFDNSDGTIGGEYATFGEVSIKRVLNRESDSTYYLNGVRCRKRDVVDIFLGTGLGPRSYSIIGQNMISRVIEAKPDDLRTYLEEAAGISKYKDRRHETELRIQHTKENLNRVNDLRLELEKQLSHLKHQANVAEKYKSLKQQERVLRAELYAIQWRQLDSQMVSSTLDIQREETALEARNSELSSTDKELEQTRHEVRVVHDAFQEVQRRYYAVGNEITRIEQDIQHHQERRQQWETDLKQVEHDWQVLKDQISENEDDLRTLERDIQTLNPQFSTISKEAQAMHVHFASAEENVQNWQNRWDEFNQTSAKTAQIIQVEKTRIQQIEQKMALLHKRQEKLQQDQERFNFSELNKELETYSKQSHEAADQVKLQDEKLIDIRKEINTLQAEQQESNTNLDRVRSELQRLKGQQASLEALQQTALGQRDNPAAAWAEQHDLGAKTRLAQQIEVEKGWEYAVEKVLGFCLQAICVDQMKEVVPHLDDFKTGNLSVFTKSSKLNVINKTTKGDLLLDKIKTDWPLDALLSGIYVANTVEEGLTICESLSTDESVITRDGVWMNRAWIKVLREEDPAAGVFQREKELKHLSQRISQSQITQRDLEKNIAERNASLHKLEEQRDHLQQTYNQQQAQSAEIHAQHKMKQERLTELRDESERFVKEQEEYALQWKKAEDEMRQARATLDEAMITVGEQTKQKEIFLNEREQVRREFQHAREQMNQKKEKMHELEIRIQTSASQKASLHQAMAHFQTQLSALNERKITLQSELASMPPIETIKKSLARALDKHVGVESELNTSRINVDTLEQDYRQLEERRQLIERDISKVRSNLEALRVAWQGWKVKTETIQEQIKETEFRLEDILKQLPQNITLEEWQAKLDQIVQRINRLGAINLVAIDEYATCQERKEYLDKQFDDLQSGLATLEEAIAKIDKETKTRFKETFDKVNSRFQELFPTVFGGGKAYLELTSDNLLEAGITMMACPPGKRNTSIYLLSGGEKSLTAIALIFSIFHLNPAPFCLLDEVDAALDDANILRFTHLVKMMSEKTQFLFISHNKMTIEMADHLIGVTMNEPGVSRLVSVDVEKAISLATM